MADLTKPITRRIGRFVVRISRDGVAIRGHHKHLWKAVSWERIAAIASDQAPMIVAGEGVFGRKVLQEMGALGVNTVEASHV